MKIALASDHRGFKLKSILDKFLKDKGYQTIDVGTHSCDSCDYPDYAYLAAKAVSNKKVDRAVIICYTGEGSVMAANKVRGVRAALAYDLKSAYMSRRHNDSNVLVLPSYFLKVDAIKRLLLRWLKEGFEGGRHLRRVRKIKDIEEKEN